MDRHGCRRLVRARLDAAAGTLEERLLGHAGVVTTVDWSPDSRRIVSAGSDGSARVWELDLHPTRGAVEVEGRQVYLLAAQQTQSGLFAAFSPDGQRVLTGDVGIAAVKIWDLSLEGDAEVVNVQTDYLAPVDVAYLPDGRIVASYDRGSVAIWDVDGDATAPGRRSAPGQARSCPCSWSRRARTASWSRWSRNVSPIVSVWNVETGTLAFDYDVRDDVITSIDWSADGRYLAVGGYGGSLHVLDADDDGRRTLVGHEPAPSRPSARLRAGRSDDRHRRRSTTRTRKRTMCRSGTGRPGRSLESSTPWECRRSTTTDPESGSRSGSSTGTSQIRDASTGEIERSFRAGSVTVMNIVFSPDGRPARDQRGGCDDPPLRHPTQRPARNSSCSEATSSSSRAWTSARTGSGWPPPPPTASCACGRSIDELIAIANESSPEG